MCTQAEAVIADDATLASAFMQRTPDDPLGTAPRYGLTAIGQAIEVDASRLDDYDWVAQRLADTSPGEFAALLRDDASSAGPRATLGRKRHGCDAYRCRPELSSLELCGGDTARDPVACSAFACFRPNTRALLLQQGHAMTGHTLRGLGFAGGCQGVMGRFIWLLQRNMLPRLSPGAFQSVLTVRDALAHRRALSLAEATRMGNLPPCATPMQSSRHSLVILSFIIAALLHPATVQKEAMAI